MKTWHDAMEQLNELLDYETVTIAGMDFLPSRILREVDPIAYKETLFNFIDGEGVDSDDLAGELRL